MEYQPDAQEIIVEECCILFFDRTVNQGFLKIECTHVNKLITGKQTMCRFKQITCFDNTKNAWALWN